MNHAPIEQANRHVTDSMELRDAVGKQIKKTAVNLTIHKVHATLIVTGDVIGNRIFAHLIVAAIVQRVALSVQINGKINRVTWKFVLMKEKQPAIMCHPNLLENSALEAIQVFVERDQKIIVHIQARV